MKKFFLRNTRELDLMQKVINIYKTGKLEKVINMYKTGKLASYSFRVYYDVEYKDYFIFEGNPINCCSEKDYNNLICCFLFSSEYIELINDVTGYLFPTFWDCAKYFDTYENLCIQKS